MLHTAVMVACWVSRDRKEQRAERAECPIGPGFMSATTDAGLLGGRVLAKNKLPPSEYMATLHSFSSGNQ